MNYKVTLRRPDKPRTKRVVFVHAPSASDAEKLVKLRDDEYVYLVQNYTEVESDTSGGITIFTGQGPADPTE